MATPHVYGMVTIYLDPVLDSGTIQDLSPTTGDWSRETITFTLKEHFDIPGLVYYSLEGVRFWEGLLPGPKKIVRVFTNFATFLWAKRIFHADRNYLEEQHIAIWDFMLQQQDLNIAEPNCCLVAACP